MKKLLAVLVSSFVIAMFSTATVTGCTVTSGQSTVGQYVDDATITARVKKRFAGDDKVSAMRISVETLKGVVELSGFAVSESEKNRAGEIAKAVPGVRAVRNNILIQPPRQ
ncbi:BON domain-containing protein [Paludibacterium purpuratum]|uniref:BON domain-containing protein n=1 Tax=Paludibacterium purpuratum TaxID=1144873 RepID=A0A4V3DVR3_9NEIS|nr:BON domain-containing protein [Paludibacterium purpuratum]TDR81969.1 BON domain-containing protein [Paludibacterium purpuratum]